MSDGEIKREGGKERERAIERCSSNLPKTNRKCPMFCKMCKMSIIHLAQLTLALVTVVELLGQFLVLLLQLLQCVCLCRVGFLQGVTEKKKSTIDRSWDNFTGIIIKIYWANRKVSKKLTFPDTDSLLWLPQCTQALQMISNLPGTWNFHQSVFQSRNQR